MEYESVAKEALTLVNETNIEGKVYAIFDIDYTLLTFDNLDVSPSDHFRLQYASKCAGILPVIQLYHTCLKKGISCVIITGRKEGTKTATISNLSKVGIRDWHSIFFKPARGKIATADYKRDIRKSLSEDGTILFNIGDSDTDFEGGYNGTIFKLPSRY